MVLTERAVLQIFFFTLCTINGLHSYPRNQPSLGILNELIGQGSKSPLIVVVDSNNQAKTLNDDEPDQREQGQGQRHSKSCPFHGDHDHNPAHNHDENHVHSNSAQLSNQEYEAALYELLRTSQNMLDMQRSRKTKNGKNGKNGKTSKNGKNGKNGKIGKKDSCSNEKTEFLAEQCSKSENSCGNFDDNDTC